MPRVSSPATKPHPGTPAWWGVWHEWQLAEHAAYTARCNAERDEYRRRNRESAERNRAKTQHTNEATP